MNAPNDFFVRRQLALPLIWSLLLALPLVALAEPEVTDPTPAESSPEEAALRETVSRMSRIGYTWGPTFSPDDRYLSFITMLTGQAQLWIVEADGGWPIQLTGDKDGVITAKWSPKDDLIAFIVPPDSGGDYQIYVIEPRAGSQPRLITPNQGGRNWLEGWTPDGSSIIYSSNLRDRSGMDLFFYDLEKDERRMVVEYAGMSSMAAVSHDSRWGAVWKSPDRTVEQLTLVDLATGAERELIPNSGDALMRGAAFSPDGQLYFTSDLGGDLLGMVRVRLDGEGNASEPEVVAPREGGEVREFQLSPDGKLLAVDWNVAGSNELEILETESLTTLGIYTPPHESLLDLIFSNDGTRLAMLITGSTSPTDLYTFDIAEGIFRQLTRTPHPGLDLEEWSRPELVRFPSHDGIEISGWLYRARLTSGQTSGPGPLALSMHGGPEEQERPFFRSLYQALLEQGISVFAPNVRGSDGFGKAFMNLDNGEKRFDAIADMKVCVDFLVQQKIADPKRLGIFGMSYGGYMTLAALTTYPDLFQAGASVSGIVNFETFFENTEPWIAAVSKTEYGDPETQVDLLRRLSPIHQVDRIRAPMVVAHGVEDRNVPVEEADQIVASLKVRGIPVEFLRFPEEGHAIRLEKNRIAYEVAIVQLFVRHLIGPDASTGAAGSPAATE